ncbi:hypothetical protein [Streptomyces sp. NPDC021224]|uniref:hypothetical protein n=1 Tax=unclassified Streptomyces TaxID=2593676 RepID=UPI00378E22C9
MDVLHWWFASVPAWFWYHATHIGLGSIGGSWIGYLVLAAIWVGQAMLFAAYALLTLFICGWAIVGAGKALRTFVAGVRKGLSGG